MALVGFVLFLLLYNTAKKIEGKVAGFRFHTSFLSGFTVVQLQYDTAFYLLDDLLLFGHQTERTGKDLEESKEKD